MTLLYAATGDDVVKIAQQGSEWVASVVLGGRGAQCLAVDPRQTSTIYAGSGERGLWRSGDCGEVWQDTRLPEPAVYSVAVSAADGAVYAGCEPSKLFKSTDGGQTWRELGFDFAIERGRDQ